jgi:hypothetical protein
MLRNKKLYAMMSFFMAIFFFAAGFCPYPGSVKLKASGPENFVQTIAYLPGEEIINERTEASKTYYIRDGSYAQDISIGAIHYKDNYKDESEQWKDIDLSFDEKNRITKAPYELTIDTENFSIKVKDKITGQVSELKLIKVGDKDIKETNKTAAKVSKGKAQWNEVATDLDLAITAENMRVNFDWIVKSEAAPHEVTFEIEDGGIPINYRGLDANREAVEVKTKKDGDKITETIEKGGNYPKIINPSLNLQVSTSYNTDDIHVWLSGSTWTAGLYDTDLYIGRLTSTNKKHGMGLRFRNATIPTDAGISNAYLQLCAGFDYSATTCYARIVGAKQLSPATFSTIGDYKTRRGTIVGGGNNSNITTAQVDWTFSEAWTMDDWYPPTTNLEIRSIIQEIKDQSGWASGNPIVLFCDDHEGRCTSSGQKRSCYAADAADPPKLHIEYLRPGTNNNYKFVGGQESVASIQGVQGLLDSYNPTPVFGQTCFWVMLANSDGSRYAQVGWIKVAGYSQEYIWVQYRDDAGTRYDRFYDTGSSDWYDTPQSVPSGSKQYTITFVSNTPNVFSLSYDNGTAKTFSCTWTPDRLCVEGETMNYDSPDKGDHVPGDLNNRIQAQQLQKKVNGNWVSASLTYPPAQDGNGWYDNNVTTSPGFRCWDTRCSN